MKLYVWMVSHHKLVVEAMIVIAFSIIMTFVWLVTGGK